MNILKGRRAGNFLIIFSVLTASCQHAPPEKNLTSGLIDIPAYFKEQASELTRSGVSLKKTILLAGVADDTLIAEPEWEKELALFTDSELSPAKLTGNITAKAEGNIVIYKAADNDTRFRYAYFRKNADSVIDSVFIELARAGIYGQESAKLQFSRYAGYSMDILNQPAAGRSTRLLIKGAFVENND
jgi:hypothetical protein